MARLLGTVFLLTLTSRFASATSCSATSPCPADTPCCSQYGECGVGAYCLGGCSPQNSYSLDSCAPEPVCRDRTTKFTNLDRLISTDKYLGNSSEADFTYSGTPLDYDDTVLLTLTESNGGTVLYSTEYVWYGKVSANMTTSGGDGVVTAFILLSDVLDEIDWEFLGYDLSQGQSNIFWQGVENHTNYANETVSSNTFENFHVYEIDWQPDSITWSVDGTAVRTLNKSATWNATTNQYNFPQTPARIETSVWGAGTEGEDIGTVEWAGGYINWNDTTYMKNDYYYSTIAEITVECYSPPSGANVSGNTSYIYTGESGLNNTVAVTGESTILSSDEATGTNTTAGADSSSTTATASSVPSASAGTGAEASGASSGSSTSGSSSTSSTSSGFSQGSSSSSSSSGSSGSSSDAVSLLTATGNDWLLLRGSMLALVVAVFSIGLL